jgi:superfamily I DNA/RNA helicase
MTDAQSRKQHGDGASCAAKADDGDTEPAQQGNVALADKNLRAAPCPRGTLAGQDNDVRVFDVEHIKGLEFEAVFFVGVNRLAAAKPDLFDKYLYVGATRAAMYLGLTTEEDALPARIRSLEGRFAQSWT